MILSVAKSLQRNAANLEDAVKNLEAELTDLRKCRNRTHLVVNCEVHVDVKNEIQDALFASTTANVAVRDVCKMILNMLDLLERISKSVRYVSDDINAVENNSESPSSADVLPPSLLPPLPPPPPSLSASTPVVRRDNDGDDGNAADEIP